MGKEKLRLARRTMELVGKPYALNDEAGLDCFSLIVQYLQSYDIEIPDNFNGKSTATYKNYFTVDPVEAKQMMLDLMSSLLIPIDPNYAVAGDILFACPKDKLEQGFLAIHGGNSSMLAATTEKGVTILPMGLYQIQKAFRVRRDD